MGMSALEVRRRVMLAQPHEAVASGAVASFVTDVKSPLPMEFDLVPIQDLHGQANPYPPGGGKNLLKPTASSTTESQVTFTVNSDGTVNTSGTASDVALLIVGEVTVANGVSYTVNGLPSDGSNTTFSFQLMRNATVVHTTSSYWGNTYNSTADETLTLRLVIRSGYNASGLKFSPMVRLNSISDGTFVPYSNICPITGHDGFTRTGTGKNLFDGQRISGYISDDGTGGTDGFSYHSNLIKVNPGANYVYSLTSHNSSSANRRIHAYDAFGNWLQMIAKNASSGQGAKTYPFTVPNNARYVKVQFYGDGSGNKSDTDIQIEYGSVKTTYEAYNGTSIETTFPTPPGAVYGGHVRDNGDGTGTLVVDRFEYTFTGNENFVTNSSACGEYAFLYNTGVQIQSSINSKPLCKSSHFVLTNSGGWSSLVPGKYMTAGTYYIGLGFDGTKDELKAWLASQASNNTPVQVVCGLTTPVTYTLPLDIIQSLIGQNNIWVDNADSVSVEYWGH